MMGVLGDRSCGGGCGTFFTHKVFRDVPVNHVLVGIGGLY